MKQDQKYPRVLFVLKRQGVYSNNSTTPVQSSGLGNSARFVVDMLNQHHIPTGLVYVRDNNDIHREVVAFGADVVIIEAFWVVPQKFAELKRVLPNVRFVVRNHSETPFLANEGMAFGWIAEYFKYDNVALACNSTRMLDDTRFLAHLSGLSEDEIESRVVLMPNYYPIEKQELWPVQNSEFVDIGCFGAIRPLKNQMIQALAALRFVNKIGKRLRFHINSGRVEMNGNPILKNITQLFEAYPEHQLVNHGWLPYDEFRAVARTMDMALQVSLSETFNIVAADTVSLGVPTVVSPEVRWAAPCYMASPNSSESIQRVMERAWFYHKMFPTWNSNLRGLKKYNRESVKTWLELFTKQTE